MTATLSPDEVVRKQLVAFLLEKNAHLNYEDVLSDFPVQHINSKIEGVEYTPWQLMEHIRITQRDIIEFIEDPDYVAPAWPKGYWPETTIGTDALWRESINRFFKDLKHMERIIQDPNADLYAAMPAGERYNLLREILIVIDHNSHHLGQLILFKKHFK